MAEANDWNTRIIEEFRANGGKLSGQLAGARLMLLTTTGAKTGLPRVAPLGFATEGDRWLVIASANGSPKAPDWYHNLVANPRASIEVGDQTLNVVARVADGETRERLWSRQKELYPGFADYEAKTTRQIPVVILETEA